MENYLFIIPMCENKRLSPDSMVVRCVQSIRKYYPKTFILIINDSHQSITSDEIVKQFFKDTNLEAIHPEVQGSACAYALNYLNQCNRFNYAIILHDSTQLIKKFPNFDCDIKFLWFFTAHYVWDHSIVPPPRPPGINTHTDEIRKFYKNLQDSQFKKDFETFYQKKDLWRGCFGNMIVISKKYLTELDNKTKILSLTPFVKTRRDRMCMESIFAMAVFYTRTFDIRKDNLYAYEGDWCKALIPKQFDTAHGVVGQYLIKYTCSR